MTENFDPSSAMAEAEERRQRNAEESAIAQSKERKALSGDLLLDIRDIVDSANLSHEESMRRLRVAMIVLRGEEGEAVPATDKPATAAPVLLAEEQELLDLFREGTLKKMEFGAWRDKRWGRLQREYERRQQGEGTDASEGSEPPAPAGEPAPAVAPAPSDEAESSAPEPAPAPADTPAKKKTTVRETEVVEEPVPALTEPPARPGKRKGVMGLILKGVARNTRH